MGLKLQEWKSDGGVGRNGPSLDVLSDVAFAILEGDKAMATIRIQNTHNPLQFGHGFDAGSLLSDANTNKNPSSSSSSSNLDLLAEAATQQFLRLTVVKEKKNVIGSGFTFPINIPKKKRTSLMRTKRTLLQCLCLCGAHSVQRVISSVNVKRKRLSADFGTDENNNEGVESLKKKKRKRIVKTTVDHLDSLLSVPVPNMPEEIQAKISDIGGGDVKLVIQKTLFDTDLAHKSNRFSIPMRQVRAEFLNQKEKADLDVRAGHRIVGIPVSVLNLDPSASDIGLMKPLCLKKWNMRRNSVYNLVSGWNSVANAYQLKSGDTVQLWSFRHNSRLCFVLLKLH